MWNDSELYWKFLSCWKGSWSKTTNEWGWRWKKRREFVKKTVNKTINHIFIGSIFETIFLFFQEYSKTYFAVLQYLTLNVFHNIKSRYGCKWAILKFWVTFVQTARRNNFFLMNKHPTEPFSQMCNEKKLCCF